MTHNEALKILGSAAKCYGVVGHARHDYEEWTFARDLRDVKEDAAIPGYFAFTFPYRHQVLSRAAATHLWYLVGPKFEEPSILK